MENKSTDNPLKLEKPIIYVDGSLIVNTDKLPEINIYSACYVERAPKNAYVINGDLTINDENAIQYSTFTLFFAKEDIVFYRTPKEPVYESSKEDFDKIMETVDENTPPLMLNLLYVSIFARFEMFMQQLALQWVKLYTKEIVKLLAKIDSKKLQQSTYDGEKEAMVINAIKKATLSNEPSRKLLHILFGNEVRIPQEIQEGYEIRNDIMHRDGFRMNGEKVLLPIDKVRSTEKALLCFLDQIDQANGRKNARLLQAWK
ncbi:MAG: hypothetical protein PUC85_04040 [bacterium]|nr:hypothetical protein [bacterium]